MCQVPFQANADSFKARWFTQVLFQDTNDDRIDLTLFEDAIHQIAKLTSNTVEVKVLHKSHRPYSVYFATHLYNL